MSAPTGPAESPTADFGGAAPSAPTLEKNAIGLGRSTIFAMAGAAPGQTVAITLAILVSASAYGTILPVIVTTAGLLCIALAFHRLNMWRQNAGATYEWVSRAFNPYVGFLVGWLMLVAFTLFVLIDVITIGPSVLALLGLSPSSQLGGAIAIVVIGSFLTLTAVRGIRLSARLQVTIALLEYTIITVFVIWAFIAVFIVHQSGTIHPTAQWLTFHGTGAGVFGASMIIAVASLSGWDAGIYLNEETEAPEKNPGKGAVLGVALTGLLFVVMYATFQGVGSSAQLQAHSSNAIAWVGQRLAGTAGDRILSFAVVISVLATTQVAIIGTSRVAYSMARDRVLPRRLGVISERYRTPAFATLLLGGSMMVLGIIDVFATSVASAMAVIINSSGVLYSIFYAVTGLAAAWYYRRLLTQSVKNAVMLGVLPLAGAALLIWVTVKGTQALTSAERYSLIGVGVAGVVMMIIAARVYKAPIFKAEVETAEQATGAVHLGTD
jgi:amino acid transporter